MMIVDAHCHIGEGRYKQQTPDQLLREMDRCGVDKAVVCPVEEYITVYNREGNDYVLQTVRDHPDRLFGFATVNPWYGKRAVEELRRAIGEGLHGLKFNSALQGFFINDEIVFPLIKVAQELAIPVYFHTGTPIFSLPLQLADLADRFPEVDLIMGHSAAADYWLDVPPSMEGHPNIYLESSLRTGTSVLEPAIQRWGPGCLLFGSDSPASTIELELRKVRYMNVDDEIMGMILGGNILRLLSKRTGG